MGAYNIDYSASIEEEYLRFASALVAVGMTTFGMEQDIPERLLLAAARRQRLNQMPKLTTPSWVPDWRGTPSFSGARLVLLDRKLPWSSDLVSVIVWRRPRMKPSRIDSNLRSPHQLHLELQQFECGFSYIEQQRAALMQDGNVFIILDQGPGNFGETFTRCFDTIALRRQSSELETWSLMGCVNVFYNDHSAKFKRMSGAFTLV